MITNYIKRIVTKYLRKKKRNTFGKYLSLLNVNPIKNVRTQKIQKLVFVIPTAKISIFSGGITSIFRIADGLSKKGLEVYIAPINDAKLHQLNISVEKLFGTTFSAKIITLKELYSQKFDCYVATFWSTCYFIKQFCGYKMYFVQDYEPYFYSHGDDYYIASKTYELGYHMVSLGGWNKKKIIEQHPNAVVDSIAFPFDSHNYKPVVRRGINHKQTIKAAVYLRDTPRRLPLITEWLCENLVKLFAKDGKKLEVHYFGDDAKLKIRAGINDGALTWEKLIELYNECDFGIVFSYTNISLVPYEMLATGLPLVELKDGTFSNFMPNNSAILFDGDYLRLYNKLIQVLSDETLLERMAKDNYELLSRRTWDMAVEEFYNIINSKCSE